jgi:hypothetical protein
MKIGNYLRIPRIIKVWLFRLFIVFGILLSLFIGNIILGLYLFGNYGDYREDQILEDIVNSVLEIPYFKKDFVIDRPEYIKTLTPEEWMNVKCKIRDVHKSDIVSGAKNYEHLSQEEKWHLNCISLLAVNKFRTDKSVRGELCSNQFNCQIRSLAVNHYVFEHPEILWSILKIVERPCDFIKIFDKKVVDEYRTEASLANYEHRHMHAAIWGAKNARSDLCNNGPFFMKSRKFVLITIQDIENKRIMDIIVRRKDID